MKRRLAAIALLLALAAPLRADRIAVAVTVTNAPTHGLTFTLNGSTRTWTTNSPSSTQMRISATNSVSATNFYSSLAANPFSGRVTISQTASNTVTMYGADGQAMVASLPSTSWGFYTATTNATSPGFVTRADYATAANTASNATDALALALTNGFVKATITNGLVTAGVTNGLTGAAVTNGILSSAKSYTDGATNAALSTARIYVDGATNAVFLTSTNAAVQDILGRSYVTAGVTNGILSSSKSYTDTATNALASSADVYRMWFRASAATVTASNVWVFHPYGINVSSSAGLMPLPARYRYIKKATIIVSGLERLSETNWLTPTFKFLKVDGYDIGDNGSAGYMETDHGTANSFAGTFNSWTNMPASAWVRTNYASVSSRVGVIWTTTNSITLPANWWTNANASLSASFWLQRLSLINANSITMSNGVAPEAYVEFSTVP